LPALCKPFATPAEADRVVASLLSAGVPGEDIRVLMGAQAHDARREAAGGFGGSVARQAPVGSFTGPRAGGAPRGGFGGDATDRPVGVFGNADRDIVVTHADGAEQVRVAGHHQLVGLLQDAGLDRETAEADVHALHHGRVLLLVRVGALDAGELRALLDGAGAPA
jgi:hypothetical protein